MGKGDGAKGGGWGGGGSWGENSPVTLSPFVLAFLAHLFPSTEAI